MIHLKSMLFWQEIFVPYVMSIYLLLGELFSTFGKSPERAQFCQFQKTASTLTKRSWNILHSSVTQLIFLTDEPHPDHPAKKT